MNMDIGRLDNLLNQSKLTNKKIGQSEKLTVSEKGSPKTESAETGRKEVSDSVSLSLDGLVKKTTMELKETMNSVRQEKVNEIKDKISSGKYKVNSRDIAEAIVCPHFLD